MTVHDYPAAATLRTNEEDVLAVYKDPLTGYIHLDRNERVIVGSNQADEILEFARAVVAALGEGEPKEDDEDSWGSFNVRNGKILDGFGYDDSSHPEAGNFVLRNNGEAWYGGTLYRRVDGKHAVTVEADTAEPTLTERVVELEQRVEALEKPFDPEIRVGDVVRVTEEFNAGLDKPSPAVGKTGKVTEIDDPLFNVKFDDGYPSRLVFENEIEKVNPRG